MSQLLLMPDPRPLDQRLGRKFFLKAPRRPGVYVMKDAADKILYIGKAKDLKQRLNNYRNANPDRMPRRHLRMVREVARIELQYCQNDTAALQREKKLIRSHKPKFNRAGVWERAPKFLVWRVETGRLEIGVVNAPCPGWRRFGPLGANATYLQKSISRLIWLAVNPDKSVGELPMGWSRGQEIQSISSGSALPGADICKLIDVFFWKNPQEFVSWLTGKFLHRVNLFERQIILNDLEILRTLVPHPGTTFPSLH